MVLENAETGQPVGEPVAMPSPEPRKRRWFGR